MGITSGKNSIFGIVIAKKLEFQVIRGKAGLSA
jgi:hypothetical protein